MENLSSFEKTIDIILAVGSVGTVGTLIATIVQNHKQNRRIVSLEERQIDVQYRPDLLVISFSGHVTGQERVNLVIENNGEDVEIVEINCPYFDNQTIVLPELLKKGGERVFCLKSGAIYFPQDCTMKMKVRDKLGRLYWVPIKMRQTGPCVDTLGIEEIKQK